MENEKSIRQELIYSRPTEDCVINSIDFPKSMRRFTQLLSPQELFVCTLLHDGMSASEVQKESELGRGTIYNRVLRARKKAVKVFGEKALDGRRLNHPDPYAHDD